MAIPSRQIGASTTTNLLWQISKQLERLICVRSCGCVTTTTTTTTVAPTTTTTTTVAPTTTTTTTTTINCNCYTLINNTNDTLTYSYIDCLGNEIKDVSIDSGITINLCTSPGSIIFTRGLILDDGVCGDVCNYSCNFYNVEPPADPPGVNWDYSYVSCDGIFIQGRLESGGQSLTDCMVVGSLTYSEGLIVTNLGDCLVNTNYTFVNCPISCGGSSCALVDYFDVWMTQACIDSWPTIGCEVWLDQNATTPFPNGNYNINTGCIEIKDGVVTAIS